MPSINRNMEQYQLLEKETIRTPSGAVKESWVHKAYVECAVYHSNADMTTNTLKYQDVTHQVLSNQVLKSGQKLTNGKRELYIVSSQNAFRYCNALAKEVNVNV